MTTNLRRFIYKSKNFQYTSASIFHYGLLIFLLSGILSGIVILIKNFINGESTNLLKEIFFLILLFLFFIYFILTWLIDISSLNYFEIYENGIKSVYGYYNKRYWFNLTKEKPDLFLIIYYSHIKKLTPYFSRKNKLKKLDIIYYKEEYIINYQERIKGKVLKEILPYIINGIGDDRFYELVESGHDKIKNLDNVI